MQDSWFSDFLPADSLPRGPHELPREAVAESQRTRIMYAALMVVAERGWSTTIADVVARAGVSRKTFYEHYADKTACLLAAYDWANETIIARVIGHVAEQRAPGADPAADLRAYVRTYLAILGENPNMARAALIDAPGSSPEILRHCAASRRRFAEVLRAWHEDARKLRPDYPPVPELVYSGAVGSMYELIFQRVSDQDGPAGMADLEPAIMYLFLSLLGAPGEAARELAEEGAG